MSNTSSPHDMVADAMEVHVETASGDRTYRTIIWVVEVDEVLYIRSYLGDRGNWYQRALVNPNVALSKDETRIAFTAEPVTDDATIDSVSEAFIAKYPPGRSTDAMVAPGVLHTTLRLNPA